jgi:hypothetical protein
VLQAPLDALEERERAADRRHVDSEFDRDRNGRERVQNVVGARQIDGELDGRGAGAFDPEMRDAAVAAQVDRAHIRAFGDAVGHGRPADARQNAAHVLVIEAQHREPVERQVVQEVDEARLQALEIAGVSREVVVVNIGDDRDQAAADA